MPRFSDGSVACLKRVMLSRSQNFMLTPEDVENIIRETGLNKAQVQVWADNFRMRYTTKKDRLDFLQSRDDAIDKQVT